MSKENTPLQWSVWDEQADAKGAQSPFGEYRVTASFEETGDHWTAWLEEHVLGICGNEQEATALCDDDYRNQIRDQMREKIKGDPDDAEVEAGTCHPARFYPDPPLEPLSEEVARRVMKLLNIYAPDTFTLEMAASVAHEARLHQSKLHASGVTNELVDWIVQFFSNSHTGGRSDEEKERRIAAMRVSFARGDDPWEAAAAFDEGRWSDDGVTLSAPNRRTDG